MNELSAEDGRKRIEQEDNLINHRVSWLIGSQSFLLTAFVLLTNNPSFYFDGQETATRAYLEHVSLLAYVIILAGLLITLCSSLGVFAAFAAVSNWKKKVRASEREFLTSDAVLAHLGGLAAVLPGPVFVSIWAMLFISEWQRLSTHLDTFYLATPLVVAASVFLYWSAHTFIVHKAK